MKPGLVTVGNLVVGNAGPAIRNGELVLANLNSDMEILDSLPMMARIAINYGRYKTCATDYAKEQAADPTTEQFMLSLVDHVTLGSPAATNRQARLDRIATRLMQRDRRFRRASR